MVRSDSYNNYQHVFDISLSKSIILILVDDVIYLKDPLLKVRGEMYR